MKRQIYELCKSINEPIALRTRSKKPKLNRPLSPLKRKIPWVSATKTRNYLLNDSLVDWLSIYGKKERKFKENYDSDFKETFLDFIMKKGVEFEEKIIDYISNILPVSKISSFYNVDKINETIYQMKKGRPIIYSAPVSNAVNRTYGIIDILIRSDYLPKLIADCPLTKEEQTIKAPLLNGNYHYLVIDIKYSTLPLAANGRHLLNTKFYPAYKSQLNIYNQAIGIIQGYTSPYSFILGRKWKYTQKGVIYRGNSCLEKLGVVDFSDRDESFLEKTNKALTWYREVITNGAHWNLLRPHRKELYPNMNIDSGDWNETKRDLAENLGEITLLWQCGLKHRDNAFSENITSWKHPECNSQILNTSNSHKFIVDKIIEINRDNKETIYPKLIKNNDKNWQDIDDELHVDFETFSDICGDFTDLPYQHNFNIIYMIGVGWKENGNWKYKSFVSQKPTLQDEYKIMDAFSNFVIERNNPTLIHWCAEERFWEKSSEKQFNREDIDEEDRNNIIYNWNLDNWLDFCNIFRTEPIIVKGAYNFGLKTIAKNMHKLRMINTEMESECVSGMMAMVKAWRVYKKSSNPIESPIMKDIIKYNEFDCKVLYDIINYLRANHIRDNQTPYLTPFSTPPQTP